MNYKITYKKISFFIRILLLISILGIFPLIICDYDLLYTDYDVSFSFILMYSIYSIVGISIFFILKSKEINNDNINYAILIQIVALFYAISGPISVLVHGVNSIDIGYYLYKNFNENSYLKVILLFILFQIGISVGSIIPIQRVKIPEIKFSVKSALPLCWALFLLSTIPYFLMLNSGEALGSENDNYLHRFQSLSGLGRVYLYFELLRLLPLTILIYHYFRKKSKLGIFFVLFFIVILTIIKPSRGLLFTTILVSLLSYNYFIKYINIKKLFIVFVSVLFLSALIVASRSNTDINSKILMKASEGSGMFENSYIVYNYLQTTEDFRYGKDYLTAPFKLLPTWLIPVEKNESLSSWLLSNYFPKLQEKGGGRMFSIVAESYLNFQFIGPFIYGFFISLLFKLLYRSAMMTIRNTDNVIFFSPVLYMLICGQLYYLMRGDTVSFFIRIVANTIIPFFLLILISKITKRSSRKKIFIPNRKTKHFVND